MAATLAELAEDTATYLLAQPDWERVDRGGYVYMAGPRLASVHRVRLAAADLAAAREEARAESRRRGHRRVEWWLGWSATPPDARERLLAFGLVPDEVPTLTGMTCSSPPPTVEGVEVRRATTLDEQLETLEVDSEVWQIPDEEREERRALARALWEEPSSSTNVHLFSAFQGGERVGFGRAVDMETGVGLFGGGVLPHARGRGVYRALVRARWEHAVERGTPLLVVQAGAMSAPVLAGLGFVSHGQIQLLVDEL